MAPDFGTNVLRCGSELRRFEDSKSNFIYIPWVWVQAQTDPVGKEVSCLHYCGASNRRISWEWGEDTSIGCHHLLRKTVRLWLGTAKLISGPCKVADIIARLSLKGDAPFAVLDKMLRLEVCSWGQAMAQEKIMAGTTGNRRTFSILKQFGLVATTNNGTFLTDLGKRVAEETLSGLQT